MLFIYIALPVGGIETFFVRMAKERYRSGLITKVLFTGSKELSDEVLLSELNKYADIFYVNDLYKLPDIVSSKLLLLSPFDKKKISFLLKGIKHIHVANGLGAMLAERLIKTVKFEIKLTVGFYHSLEFSWGHNKKLPYFERVHREFIFKYMPKNNLFLFSETMIDFHELRMNVDLSQSSSFRIGVIDRKDNEARGGGSRTFNRESLKICSVGRVVDFKTYNSWMLDVVLQLITLGVNVVYDVYGDGDSSMIENLNQKIKRLELQNNVFLRGPLPYSDFDTTVSSYDLFVGSGTAIIQASSLGIPCIIGIESIEEPLTYGFFKDFSHVDYNMASLPYKKVTVLSLILELLNMSHDDRMICSIEHSKSVEDFYIDTCNSNFESQGKSFVSNYSYSRFLYELSWKLSALHYRLFENSVYRNKYVEKV